MPTNNNNNEYNKVIAVGVAVLPNGDRGYTACPELLTEDEAIRYLRLDANGCNNPKATLKYYRDQGVLQAVQIGKKLVYPRKELDSMVEKLLEKRGDSR